MAYPSIRSASTVAYAQTTTVAYPATIVAGDILVLVTLNTSSTAESGWTLASSAFSGAFYLKVQYKTATGSETGNLTLATSSYGRWMAAIDTGGVAPVASTSYTAGQDTPKPPALTPGAGAVDYLWLIYGFETSTSFTSPAVPSGWTLSSSVNGCIAGYKQYPTSSYDPGAFTDSDAGTANAYSATIALWFTPPPWNPIFFGGGI